MKKSNIFILIFLCISSIVYSIPHEPNYWHYYQLDYEGLGNCGPASVAMVYKYSYGKHISLGDVSKYIFGRDEEGGSTLYSLHRALYFLNIPSEIIELPDIISENFHHKDFKFYKFMYIINVEPKYILSKPYEYEEGGHYIVVFDYFDGWYKVNDPLNKYGSIWYYEEDIENALRYNKGIRIEKWQTN